MPRLRSIEPAVAACLWAVPFGLLSLYWAAGGEFGISTLAQSIQDAAVDEDEGTRNLALISGVLKIAAGLLALWTLRPFGGRKLQVVGLSFLWGCAILLTLYGVVGFFEKLLMALGAISIPEGLGEDVVWWYVVLWEPLWILGGVLFIWTAWLFGRRIKA